jgi:hypothetical protein
MKERRRLFNFQAHFDSYRGQMMQSRQLYCRCGYPVVKKEMLDDELLPSNRFYDYTDYEQEISVCPGCGSRLSEDRLSLSAPADGL